MQMVKQHSTSSAGLFWLPARPLLRKILTSLLLTVAVMFPSHLLAANCTLSPYAGKATWNEFFKDNSNQDNDPDDFVEIKILDTSITESIFNTWKIQICEDDEAGNNNDNDGCSGYISVNDFTDKSIPWLVLKNGTIGQYVNFKTGFDAILVDGNNNLIDYLTVDGYNEAENQLGCTAAGLPYDYQASSPGASDKFIFRIPDGTGDWGSAPSASAPPSEDDTNDTDPNGDPTPTITVANVTVNKGQTATFTFNLEGAPKTYNVSVDYETLGGTAVAGVDYVYTSGTATILAGQSSTTVDVNTIAMSPSGVVYFYLFLDNQVNGTPANIYPIGTILGPPTGEWYMDESAWDGTTDEVADNSGSNNHGTAYNGLTTDIGYLCNGGVFDGSNDYVEIPHDASLNGSDGLTYMAWIKPDSWSGVNQIMSKSVHGGGDGRAQMGIFAESGVLKGRAETPGNVRHEISTSLPATGSWTHVALTFSGNVLTLYINGSVAAVKTFASTTLVQTIDPLQISKRVDTDQYYFDGQIDEVLVIQSALAGSIVKSFYDNYQLGLNWNGTARSCPGQLHHIQIEHDGAAITCKPEQVTFKACANADCTSLVTSDVVVDLTPTGWIGGDQVTITNGTLDFELQHFTAEVVTLGAANPSPAASESPVYTCVNTSVPNTSCNIEFFEAGLIYDIPKQTSCATSADVTVQAIATDPATSLCLPLFGSADRNLKVWTQYINPDNDGDADDIIGSPTVDLTNNIAPTTTTTLPTSEPGTTNITLNFDANASATFKVNYNDAGELSLNMRYDGTGTEAGLVLLGSNNFVTVPDHLTVYSDDPAAACLTNDGACTPFKAAGESFDLKVKAVCADDTTVTPNFRLDNIALSSALVAPIGGTNATLGTTSFNMQKTDQGQVTISQTVSEVGVFTISATPPVYLGETIPVATSESLGRFYPAYFDTVVLNAHEDFGLTAFTYSGEPFTVEVTARNLGDGVTTNYFADFVNDAVISNNGDATGFTNNVFTNAYFTSAAAGVATRTDVTYTFASKETPPATLNIQADENNGTGVTTDDITSDTHTEGSALIRSGRLVMDNAFGPEQLPLTMPLRVEYYDDAGTPADTSDDGFIVNPDDSSSSYTSVGYTLGNFTGNLNAADVAASGAGAFLAGLYDTTNPVSIHAAGDPTIGPGAGNEGSVNILLSVPSWLEYNWGRDCDGDGANDNGPCGTASFGLYRGDDRIIFQREVLP